MAIIRPTSHLTILLLLARRLTKKPVVGLLICCTLFVVGYVVLRGGDYDIVLSELMEQSSLFESAEKLLEKEFLNITSSLPKSVEESKRCSPPNLPLYTQLIYKHRPEHIPANICATDREGSTNWLRVRLGRVYVKEEFADARCIAEPIVRLNDQTSHFGAPITLKNGDRLPSLGFRASCTTPAGKHHSSVYYGMTQLPESVLKDKLQGEATVDRDNIVILGIDSVSRLESLRSLETVSRLLAKKLEGLTLTQYNIMGDGTPAALLPILTGIREEEMPESRKGFANWKYLDQSMRWIFRDLHDLGYLTMFSEEDVNYPSFQLRFHGFKQEPTDFYLRPVLSQQEHYTNQGGICIGDETTSSRQLKAIKELFTMYPKHPKFAFLFLSRLSHERKDISLVDREWAEFLEWFHRQDLIGNTTLIVMSDHGLRAGPLRNTMQGKLEESLPLMTIALSSRLKNRINGAERTLRGNQLMLTTPRDIYKTLLSIAGVEKSKNVNDRHAAYSLIEQIVPGNRSCHDSGIPMHWCSCLSKVRLDKPESHQLAVMAAQFAIDKINDKTQQYRNKCSELFLAKVNAAEVSLASSGMSKRRRSINMSPFATNSEDKSTLGYGYVTVRFLTRPGSALFEATLHFKLAQPFKLMRSLVSEASRINRYAGQDSCLTPNLLGLRKFCICFFGGK